MDAIQLIEDWYASQCNGDWEHGYGITISTLDNPGWSVEIALTDTQLETKPFPVVVRQAADIDWVRCEVVNAVFKGSGGPHNLEEILRVFIRWASE